jgi:nicotinate-nucleotide adenylyltransferase
VRIGILGGTFNPPHIGHLVCAQEALAQLALDKVVFIPVGQAPHREIQDDPGADVRLELVDLAIGDDDRFESSRIEIDREGPSYTSDTLRRMRSAAPEDEHVLILGGDQAAGLPTWHAPEEVLSLATVAVVERVSWTRNAIGIKIARLKGSERVRYLDMPLIQVSSSAVRRRVALGRPVRYLVPDAVASSIRENELYGAKAGEEGPPGRHDASTADAERASA